MLVDHLDEQNSAEVRASVEAACEKHPTLPVILDLGKVSFIVSFSLGSFVELSQQMKGRGRRLVLVNLQPPVRQVMAITRLNKLFEIKDDMSDVAE